MEANEESVVRERSGFGDKEATTKPAVNPGLLKPKGGGDTSSNEDITESPVVSDIEGDVISATQLSQGTAQIPSVLNRLVEGMPTKWANLVVRLCMTIIMISGFSLLVYMGPLTIVMLILLIQLACFLEIIQIGYVVYRSHDLPWFRTLSWFFLFTSNYCFFGESLIYHFRILLAKEEFLTPLVIHHRFISFCLYCCGVVGFVLSLVRKHYLKQFFMFGWTHVTLLIMVTSSQLMIQNVFHGLIWFLVPVAMVICNDIMAYVCGFLCGKTPLIQLSPKKTWEGFIGGGFFSMLFGVAFSMLFINNKHFICPIEYDDLTSSLSLNCTPNAVFIPLSYPVPKWLFFFPLGRITWYPYMTHCLIIGLFVSIVGPFGGFFASGFKRAFKIKDFGDAIPGHGGIMDRFDCQIIIGTFVYFYYNSFVRVSSPAALLQQIVFLPDADQLAFFGMLVGGLVRRGLLPANVTAPLVAYLENQERQNQPSLTQP